MVREVKLGGFDSPRGPVVTICLGWTFPVGVGPSLLGVKVHVLIWEACVRVCACIPAVSLVRTQEPEGE